MRGKVLLGGLFLVCVGGFLHAQTTVVFQSKNGDSTLVRALEKSFAGDSSFTVVEQEKVASVLSYYPTPEVDADPDFLVGPLMRAKEHYLHFQYEEAAAELGSVLSFFEKRPGLMFEQGHLLRNAYATLALIRLAQKDEEAARQTLKQLFRLDPKYSFDEKLFPPSFMNLAHGEREVGTAKLRVESHPKVAEVFLNGIYRGVTPLTITALPAGRYALRIAANNYQPFSQEVDLASDQTSTIRRELPWNPKLEGRKPQVDTAVDQVEEGLRIADLLKVDKVVWVEGGELVMVKAVDRKYRAGHIPLEQPASEFSELVSDLKKQLRINLAKNPLKYVSPVGMGDPALLTGRDRGDRKPLLWGAIGTAVVGGIVGGIVAASGSSEPATGSVALDFK